MLQSRNYMKTARYIFLCLTIASVVIISGFINISAGYAFCCLIEVERQEYIDMFNSMGTCLLISSFFMIAATILAYFKKVWIPLIFNIIGSCFYIYTVSEIYAIPNTALEKSRTEFLAERHLLTVIVTLSLFALTIFNYFDESNVNKRNEKKNKKINSEDRQLTAEEKIL